MTNRLVISGITVFWVVMNVLLWRAEFGFGRSTLTEIPIATVVDRLLNAPDASVLVLQHRDERLGLLRWIPTVTDQRAVDGADSREVPEGMVLAAGYALDIELNLQAEDLARRWRVLAHVEFDTNHVWQEFSLRLFQRPVTWEVTARAGESAIQVRQHQGAESWEQTFSTDDFGRLTGLLGPYAALIPAPLAGQFRQLDPQKLSTGLEWRASNDWLKLGRSRIRVYRVEATLFERHQVVVYLSRAGEILKVQFPEGYWMVNEAMPGLARETSPAVNPAEPTPLSEP